MTNRQILEKAIQKAVAGGWDMFGWRDNVLEWKIDDRPFLVFKPANIDAGVPVYSTKDIIFNHDFAKALWGEEFPLEMKEVDTGYGKVQMGVQGTWPGSNYFQYHLQQMVIAENPLDYLKEHI